MSTDGVEYDPLAADPFPAFEGLRERCPVHYQAGFADGFYSLSRYADVLDEWENIERWSRAEGQGPLRIVESGMNADPPQHDIHRRLVTPLLTARRVTALEPFMVKTVDSLLDNIVPAGSADLIAELAQPLPLAVMCEIVGLPTANRKEYERLAYDFIAAHNSDDEAALATAKAAIYTVFSQEIRWRRSRLDEAGGDPKALPDDALSALVAAKHPEGRHFTESELLPTLGVGLLVGGVDSIPLLIGSLVLRLLENDLWEAATRSDETIASAIEESLRFDPPVIQLFRTARNATCLHGVDIPKGAKVAAIFASANRDPAVFADPDTFDIERPRGELRKHLAFGAGISRCPGANLGRREALVAIRELAARCPNLKLDAPCQPQADLIPWGPAQLNVRWDMS